jgi:hypothetical protein
MTKPITASRIGISHGLDRRTPRQNAGRPCGAHFAERPLAVG